MKYLVEIILEVESKQIQKVKEFNARAKNHIPYWIDKWIEEIKKEKGSEEIDIIMIDNKVDITAKVINLKNKKTLFSKH